MLNGREHRLVANEGTHHLHGGRLGFGKRLWRVVDVEHPKRVRLALHVRRPGKKAIRAIWMSLSNTSSRGSTFEVRFECLADEDTPFSPTFHPYFNMPQESQLLIHGDAYLPVRSEEVIPTGEVYGVAGKPFDFLSAAPRRPVRGLRPLLGAQSSQRVRRKVAAIERHHATIRPNQPGLQFYGGQYPPELGGICLEPQGLPNAVNVPPFSVDHRKSGTLWQTTFRYQLSDRAGFRYRGWSPTARSSR